MLPSGILFALFLAGCWLYCLMDAALTPNAEFPGLAKRTWIAIIAVTFIAGAIAWVITLGARRASPRPSALTGEPVTIAGAFVTEDGYLVVWYPHQPPPAGRRGPTRNRGAARHPAAGRS